MADSALTNAAVQTYLYGYPLVYNLEEIQKIFDGSNRLAEDPGPNRFAPARHLLGPEAKFVSPNNDTLYLLAACDLRDGPLLLDVPDTNDRYYVLQFIDAWTNNFAYVGRRATGTEPRRFLLAPPDFAGDAPDGTDVIEAPTTVFAIAGRIQVDGEFDLAAVHELQDRFSLTPTRPSRGGELGVPRPDTSVADDLSWWERFRVALAAYPPGPGDEAFVETARQLGLAGPDASLVDPDPEIASALRAGREAGESMLEELSKTSLSIVDGWSSAMHAFDYNLDALGLGTVDEPEWKIADRTTAYVTRAVAARLGLWGNHGYEARYDILWQDDNGDVLDGANSYELTLSPPPVVDAFWSLTMYDEPDYYLVENDIDRYSIGDRTPGLETDPDGSVTILMQHATPPEHAQANWLPAPDGPFRPILRSYEPKGPMLDGSYVLPGVRRLP